MSAPARIYRHGAFVWFTHLADHEGDAMSFYSEVFGWEAPAPVERELEDSALVDRGMPTPFVIESACVDLRRAGNIGPGWVSCLSIADVSAGEQKAEALGANILQPAMDVPGVGCFALIEDPGGARLFLVKAMHGDPEPSTSRVGEIFSNELWAQSVDEASRFYCDLIGYDRTDTDADGLVVLTLNGEPVASVLQAPAPFLTRSALSRAPVSSQWLPYVVTDDVDTTVSRARRIGGSLVGEVFETRNGARSAVLLDHGGQAIGTIAPAGA